MHLPSQTPTPHLAEALHRDGFAVLPNHLSRDACRILGQRFDERIAAEGDRAGCEVHQEAGTRRLANLVDKGNVFDPVWMDPVVLGCVAHILDRPFRLSSLNAREPLPGHGQQNLHADWGPGEGSRFHVVNSLWLLDDLDAENGATRVVPGSHRRPGPVSDAGSIHADEITIRAAAGSVIVVNAHAWHGGSRNRSGARRRIIHAYYVAAEHPQQCDFPRLVSPATRERLPEDARILLGLEGAGWSPAHLLTTTRSACGRTTG